MKKKNNYEVVYPSGYVPKEGDIEDPRVTDFKESKQKTPIEGMSLNGFTITSMESIPPKSNPFLYDQFHVGAELGDEVTIMYSTTNLEDPSRTRYLIIIDHHTGKRAKITLPIS